MENATQRARAEGELGIMKQLQQQHLEEQQRWQKRDNLQYFMQTVNPNLQGDVHPVHQAVMLHALGMTVPGNLLSGAQGSAAGASTSSMPTPSLTMVPPGQESSTFNNTSWPEGEHKVSKKTMARKKLLLKWQKLNDMPSTSNSDSE